MEKGSSGRIKSRGLWIRGEGTIFRRYHGPASQSFTKPPLAQAVLDARAAHPGATLADLHDPDLMPPNPRKAHTALVAPDVFCSSHPSVSSVRIRRAAVHFFS